MKFLNILLLISTIFAIIYAEANEETQIVADSPLISYLLSKIQRLEAKMTKPTVRNTRQVDVPIDNTSKTDDKKPEAVKECPPQTVSYIRWGNNTCPYGANTMYQGVAAGGITVILVHHQICCVYLLIQCVFQTIHISQDLIMLMVWSIKLVENSTMPMIVTCHVLCVRSTERAQL